MSDLPEAPAARLLDLSVFFATIAALGRDKSQDPRVDKMLQKGNSLAKRYMDEYREEVEQFLRPTFDLPGFRGYQREWDNFLKKPVSNTKANVFRGDWILQMIASLKRKSQVFKTTFGTGLPKKTALDLARAESIDDPIEKAQVLLSCRFVGSDTLTRKFCKQALPLLGAIQTEIEALSDDVSYAKNMGDYLRVADLQTTQAASVEEALEKEAAADELRSQIEDVATDSVSPIAVKQTVADVVTDAHDYATKTAERFGLSEDQEKAMMSRGKSLIASTAGSGKCLVGSTLVSTPEGMRTIDSCVNTQKVVSVDAVTLKASLEKGIWLDMGESEVISITTASGIELSGTPEHPLLVWDGKPTWKTLSSLVEGDHLLVMPGHAREGGVSKVDPEEAYLIGLWMGNGNCGHTYKGGVKLRSRSIKWSSCNTPLIHAFFELSKKFWNKLPATYGSLQKEHAVNSVAAVNHLHDLDLIDKNVATNARTKVIPSWLMSATAPERIRFLQGLFDTDGTAGDRGFEYLSASEDLAHGVHQMLIGLGVVGRLKPRDNVKGYEDHTYWRILVAGDQLRNLQEICGFRHDLKKKAALAELCDKPCNPNVGCYPHVSAALKEAREEWKGAGRWKGAGQRLSLEGYSLRVSHFLDGSRKPSKKKLLEILEGTVGSTLLKNLTSFFPDPIIKTYREDKEKVKVYDFNVPTTHSFIANGIVSHNTATLTAKVLYHIEELDCDPSSIMATSFSKKSAYELTERIRKNGGAPWMSDPDVMEGFGTTHSVSGKLLSKYARRGYKEVPVLSGGQSNTLIKVAMLQVEMEGYTYDKAPTQGTSFFAGAAESIERIREETPEEVIPAADDWEAALQQAIAWHTQNGWGGWNDFAVKISKDFLAKKKTKESLSDKQRDAINKVFKAAGIQLQASAITTPWAKPATVSAAMSTYWKEPANQWFNTGDEEAWGEKGKQKIGYKQVALEISKWKANLVTPETAYANGGGSFAAAYAAYEWLKKNDRNAGATRDHDDILIETCQMLVKDPKALGQVQSRYKLVMVDESQDLNKAQSLLFGLISGQMDPKTQAPKEDGSMTADTYAMIGDPNQAIYSFRGADADIFIDRDKDFGGDFKTYKMGMNYRSGSAIVDAANRLASHFGKSIPMVCTANKEKRGEGSITSVEVPTPDMAPYLVAEQIKEMIDNEGGFAPNDFGVCIRTNAESYGYCMELLKRGIPFRSKASFFNDPTSKVLILWLRLANASVSDTSIINEIVLGAYNTPRFGLDKGFVENIQRAARGKNYLSYLQQGGWQDIYEGNQSWRNERAVWPYMEALSLIQNASGSPVAILDQILNLKGSSLAKGMEPQSITDSLIEKTRTDPAMFDQIMEDGGGEMDPLAVKTLALAPIDPLTSVLEEYEDLSPAMAYVAELQSANATKSKQADPKKANQKDDDYEAPAVMVDTVHQWKGLEAPHIYVAMSQGTFPHHRSIGKKEEMESERRLAYVAMTRGRDSVTIVSSEEDLRGNEAGVSQFTTEACIAEDAGALRVADESTPTEEELNAFILQGNAQDIQANVEAIMAKVKK